MSRVAQRTARAGIVAMLLAAQAAPAAQGPQGPSEVGETARAVQGAGEPEVDVPWWSPENLALLRDLGIRSWWEVPRLGIWGGSIDAGIDRYRQGTRLPDGGEFKFAGRLATEGITLRNQGFSLVDPRLLTGSAALRFALQQSRQETGAIQSAQRGQLTGYNFDATLLSEKPYNTSFVANRSESFTTQLSGSSTRAENRNRALLLRWREDSILRDKEILPYFSAMVQVRDERTKEASQLADQVFRREEQRSLFGVTAHNGFETGDLDFRYERTRLDNLLFPEGSYGGQTVNLNYSGDFGANRNRRWDSRIDYSSRSGAAAMQIFSLNERLSIDHFLNLSSGYNYSYTRQVTENGAATVASTGMQLQHRLYNNLSSSLGLSAVQQTLPNGRIEARGAQAAFQYNHAVPWNGQLSASLSGGAQVTDNRLSSSQVPVLSASYQAPPSFGAGAGFLLNDSFIVAESIIVVDLRGGARLVAAPGIDYLVVAEGIRTRIVPQPTSLVILPGDPLEVSYIYNLDPSLKFRTNSRSISVNMDWNWIAVSASHDETLQTPLSGGDSQFLTNRRSDSARLDLRGNWDRLQARGEGTVARYNYTQLVYDERRLSQHVSYSPRDNLVMSLSASQARMDYRLPQRQSDTRNIRLDIDWVAPGGWFTTTYLSRRVLRDTQMPSDALTELAVRVNRRWTKLSVSGTFGVAERVRGGVQTANLNFHLSAIRDF